MHDSSFNKIFFERGQITHSSLFTGIGGFDLAAEWRGYKNIFQCEIEPYCQKLLKQNFPQCELFSDIKTFDAKKYEGQITILTGGFPCQPFSVAGIRKGKEDSRFLWHEMLRIITEVKPKIVIGENVPGIISMALNEVCADLENQGYEVQPIILPACAVNAPHRRDRVWFVAISTNNGCNSIKEEARKNTPNQKRNGEIQKRKGANEQCGTGESDLLLTNSDSEHREEFIRGDKLGYEGKEKTLGRSFYETDWNREWTEVASELCRVDDGLPKKLDANKRITALGNAIVPQVAYEIFGIIENLLLPDTANRGEKKNFIKTELTDKLSYETQK